MDQQKDIADLERQLAALSTDNSASARAKKAKLQAELAEKNADLEETYYDRSISNQQEALNKELEDFQAAKEKEIEELELYLENVEVVVADSLMTVQANATTVYDTLNAKADEYNLNLSDAVTMPWQDGALAVSDYQESFDTAMSSTTDQLDAMKSKWQELIDIMQEASKASVDAINKENQNYTNATKQQNTSTPATNPGSGSGSGSNSKKEPTVGSTVKVDPNAPIYTSADGTKKHEQYYSDDPYYTVVDKKGDAVLVRHKSQNTGYTGWFKDKDITTTSTQKYAKGTKGVNKDQWAIIDELGEELVLRAKNGRLTYMEKGSGVIPADLTSNLMEWGKLDPSAMLDRNRPQVGVHPEVHQTEIHIDNSIAELIHIDNCSTETLPDVEKIVNKAIEKNTQRLNQSLRKYVR